MSRHSFDKQPNSLMQIAATHSAKLNHIEFRLLMLVAHVQESGIRFVSDEILQKHGRMDHRDVMDAVATLKFRSRPMGFLISHGAEGVHVEVLQ